MIIVSTDIGWAASTCTITHLLNCFLALKQLSEPRTTFTTRSNTSFPAIELNNALVTIRRLQKWRRLKRAGHHLRGDMFVSVTLCYPFTYRYNLAWFETSSSKLRQIVAILVIHKTNFAPSSSRYTHTRAVSACRVDVMWFELDYYNFVLPVVVQ